VTAIEHTVLSSRLAKRRWDFQRFALTPAGIALRARVGTGPPVVAISIPKAGTHLSERIVCLHPRYYRRLTRTIWGDENERLARHITRMRRGQVLCTHSYFSNESLKLIRTAGVRIVFTVRDPRDILLSYAHYVHSDKGHPWHPIFRKIASVDDRAALLIEGDSVQGMLPFPDLLDKFWGWLSNDSVILQYEDLIAEPETRLRVIRRLFEDLDAFPGEESLREIANAAISAASPTFRQGKAGGWRSEFSAELLARLDAAAGDQLAFYDERIASLRRG